MVLWSSKDRVIDSEGVIKAERQCTVYEGRSRLSGGVDAPYQVAAREREREWRREYLAKFHHFHPFFSLIGERANVKGVGVGAIILKRVLFCVENF
jgi:hypothetical protein